MVSRDQFRMGEQCPVLAFSCRHGKSQDKGKDGKGKSVFCGASAQEWAACEAEHRNPCPYQTRS